MWMAASDVADENMDDILSDLASGSGIFDYGYGIMRLRANPSPSVLDTLRLAQGHPVMAEHATSFIVEFAADIVDNTTGVTGSDGLIDVVGPGSPPTDNSIRWYSVDNLPPAGSDYGEFETLAAPGLADEAFVWRPNGTNWPYLLRLRYRLTDRRGRFMGADGEPGRPFRLIFEVVR